MLARRALVTGRAALGSRNMATLKEIELRLKSVRNIEKITKVDASSLLSNDHELTAYSSQ